MAKKKSAQANRAFRAAKESIVRSAGRLATPTNRVGLKTSATGAKLTTASGESAGVRRTADGLVFQKRTGIKRPAARATAAPGKPKQGPGDG